MALVAVLLACPAAHATVYSWKGEGGVRIMSNDPDDVPKDQQGAAEQYTAKAGPKPAPAEDASSDALGADVGPGDPYRRGFDAGLQAADREVALAGELAPSILASVPRTPPPPTIIYQYQAAPPVAPQMAYGYPPPYPYYGVGAPYGSYPFGYPFLVTVESGRHAFRHGFQGARGRPYPNGPFSPVAYPNGPFSRFGTGRMR